MQQDASGWGSAPPAEFWHCPECGMRSPVADWPAGPSAQPAACPECVHCARLDTRSCPHCAHEYTAGRPGAAYTDLGTSARLSQADGPGHVERESYDDEGRLIGILTSATPRGDKCPVCEGEAA